MDISQPPIEFPWWFFPVALGAPLLFGYLLGSIPFGVVLTRLAGLGDVRKIGSGNIGTTNVLRTGRKDLAALTLLGDALKGTLAVIIALRFGEETGLLAGIGAFLGHLFPVWLGFKGGKGVATYLGIVFPFSWIAGLIFAAVWLLVAVVTRYSSLSALVASIVTPVAFRMLGAPLPVVWTFVLLSAVLIWKHRDNIARLRAGTESRIGRKRGP